jgi:hypothetical protein
VFQGQAIQVTESRARAAVDPEISPLEGARIGQAGGVISESK